MEMRNNANPVGEVKLDEAIDGYVKIMAAEWDANKEVVSWWRIFTKGGQPGWGSLIPIYNLYLILKIVGRPWWFLLLLLIPVVNVIVAILITNDLSKSFGRGLPFTLGLIFLPFIFYPILAWSEATYQGPSAS